MNTALTIQEKLKDLRAEHGLTLEQLEQRTRISKSALGSYEAEGYKDISHTSIVTLAKFYGVSADYLLGLTETKNHPNADLAELRLSDEIIELLKSGKINTRLLCEIAACRSFVKLLASFIRSPQERQVVVMCRQLGIDYKKLTSEEFQLLMKVLGEIQAFEYSERQAQEKTKIKLKYVVLYVKISAKKT